jgi:hypothetical protein
MKWIIIIISFLLFFGGRVRGKIECQQPDLLKKMDNTLTLRCDGLYNTFDTSMMRCGEKTNQHYITYNSLIFVNNNNVIYSYGGGSLDNTQLSINFYSNPKNLLNSIGDYSLKVDTVKATIPIGLFVWGMRVKTFLASFQGIVKNRDTIIDWHMIHPYPTANPKFNNGFIDLTTPKLLYFIESKELLSLDSLYHLRLKKER